MEVAIANADYDPYDDKWRSPEVRANYVKNYPVTCPTPGSGEFNPYAQ